MMSKRDRNVKVLKSVDPDRKITKMLQEVTSLYYCSLSLGLPQLGHIPVPKYFLYFPGYHFRFPPAALPGHKRGHASAGT